MANCTKRSVEEFPEDFMSRKERENGGVIIHILLSIYLFMTLAIVCDEYLVTSLERFCEGIFIDSVWKSPYPLL